MEPTVFESILEIVAADSGTQVYAIAFAVLLACGFGLPLPEDLVLFTLGYLSYTGQVRLGTSIVVALAGVLVGDSIIYLIGRVFGERVIKFPGFRRVLTPKRVEKVRQAFHANGSIYLFFARFTPGVRAVTFWSAGLFKIPFRTFLLLDGVAALLSVPLLTYLAYALGEAFHTYIDNVREGVTVVAAVALTVVILVTLRRRKQKRRRTESQAAQLND